MTYATAPTPKLSWISQPTNALISPCVRPDSSNLAPTIVGLAEMLTALTVQLTSMTGVALAIHAKQLSASTLPHFPTNALALMESTGLQAAHA